MEGAEPFVEGHQAVAVVHFEILVMQVVDIGMGGDAAGVTHFNLVKADVAGDGAKAGAVQLQVIGLRDIKPKPAIEKYGADLFIKENDKKDLGKEKIPEKIFEIERRLLIRSRA